jgi:hypothetical protein
LVFQNEEAPSAGGHWWHSLDQVQAVVDAGARATKALYWAWEDLPFRFQSLVRRGHLREKTREDVLELCTCSLTERM